MQLSFDKRCSFPTQNNAFSLGQTRLMSGKLSRLKSKHTRKNRHASGLNENGSNIGHQSLKVVSLNHSQTSESTLLLFGSVAPLKSLYFHWTTICSSSIVFTPRSLFLLFVLLFSGLIVEDLTTAATSPLLSM